jgi:hypothetical protein
VPRWVVHDVVEYDVVAVVAVEERVDGVVDHGVGTE